MELLNGSGQAHQSSFSIVEIDTGNIRLHRISLTKFSVSVVADLGSTSWKMILQMPIDESCRNLQA
ncbi:hypothetical protein [Coleofasciculus sp. G2-EDA-02]|uniref:hypothetical protein n=1 Tax=Coleofasciculus sp. G2-EDA-02 TaxID=3069529 RepID=UPI0040647417